MTQDTSLEKGAARWASGTLNFYSETGTEGGYWAIQVDGYSHGPEFDCGQQWCPLNYREIEGSDGSFDLNGTGRRMSEEHASYDGLYVLRSGDALQLLEAEGKPEGEVIRLQLERQRDQYSAGAYAAGGILAAHDLPAAGVDPATWESWFFEARRARVQSGQGRLPKPVEDLSQVFRGGHYL